MSKHRLTIRIAGSEEHGGAIDFDDFATVCDALAKSLKSVEEITGGRTGFQLSDLRTGSAVVVIDAVKRNDTCDYRSDVLSTFRRAIADLNEGVLSPDLASLDVEPFRELAQTLRNGVGMIKIGRVRLTRTFADSLDKVSVKGISSHGSVTGLLERVNLHDRKDLSLYPPDSSKQVSCRFPDSLLEAVREGLGRTVTVSGELQYVAGESYPRRCNVTNVLVHPLATVLPTLYDVRELGSWGTDGLSAVDFVRAIRDE